MFAQTWYNQSIKNYIYAFGALFQNISIQRLDSSGSPIPNQLIKVPISFGPKQKWLVRLTQDPNAGNTDLNSPSTTQKSVEIVLPRMGYELHSISYDASRKLPNINKNVAINTGTNESLKAIYNPVAYIFPFELTIASKNLEDIFQIIEQILPFFEPSFSIEMEESQISQSKSIAIQFTGMTLEDSPYEDFKQRRVLLAHLNFDLLGYLYQPMHIQKIITDSEIRFFAQNNPLDSSDQFTGEEFGEKISVTPNPSDAPPNSNFDFTTTISEINQ